MERLLSDLGNPHHDLAKAGPIIHVAGTNGKGSTIAFMDHLLRAKKYSVNRYTSPHLIRFNERITLNGLSISDDVLTTALKKLLAINNNQPITFFEATTALAFDIFAQYPADATIIEVGMGGRLDATNIFSKVDLCVITPISFDHEEFLGNDLKSIAREKAGIIKAGAIVVSCKQQPEVLDVIQDTCVLNHATLLLEDRDWHVSNGWLHIATTDVIKNDEPIDLHSKSLVGAHQFQNSATAIVGLAALGLLDLSADLSVIEIGLHQTKWPGRLEQVVIKDLEHHRCRVDGAHNKDGMETLRLFLLDCRYNQKIAGESGTAHNEISPSVPPIVVMAVKKEKPVWDMVDTIIDETHTIFLTEFPNPHVKCWSLDELRYGLTNHHYQDKVKVMPLDAVLKKLLKVPPWDVLFCGSLYFAGHVLGNYRTQIQ